MIAIDDDYYKKDIIYIKNIDLVFNGYMPVNLFIIGFKNDFKTCG